LCDLDEVVSVLQVKQAEAKARRDTVPEEEKQEWQVGPNLGGEDLRDVDLRGKDLAGLDLEGTDLRGANLAGTDMDGCNLSGAHLQGAQWSDDIYGGAKLRGALLLGLQLLWQISQFGARTDFG
jgi:uncharacterized protein YjbI with pentapeptide repeats